MRIGSIAAGAPVASSDAAMCIDLAPRAVRETTCNWLAALSTTMASSPPVTDVWAVTSRAAASN
jgi:hypothetical protein